MRRFLLSFKRSLRSLITMIGASAWLMPVLARPPVRRVLEKLPGGRSLYPTGWERVHPFDRLYGTDTSGTVPVEEFSVDAAALEGAHLYGGSQPSVLRAVLKTLPALDGFSFVDLGCGKGRPLFVAAEFPFRAVIGVELSPELAGIASRNAAIISQRLPGLAPVQIVTGDATAYPLPAGPFVLFLYNPFGRTLIEKVVANIEAELGTSPRSIYVVYYNPVFGDCFDASKLLSRRYAHTLPYGADELGYGPDEADPVVIWQPGDGRPLPGTEARIVITTPEMRSELRPVAEAG